VQWKLSEKEVTTISGLGHTKYSKQPLANDTDVQDRQVSSQTNGW